MAPIDGERSTSKASRPTTVEAGLAPAAQFIETDRGNRTDQREAGGERKQQRQRAL